jgi:hypothetical protein
VANPGVGIKDITRLVLYFAYFDLLFFTPWLQPNLSFPKSPSKGAELMALRSQRFPSFKKGRIYFGFVLGILAQKSKEHGLKVTRFSYV